MAPLNMHTRSLKKATIWLALLAIMILIFSIRLMVLNKYEAPPSVDLAGDLVVLDAYISDDPVHPEAKFQRPPIAYLLVLLPLTRMFPTFLALKIYDALLTTLIALPFFLICREITESNVAALISTALFTFAGDYNEVVGWGGARDLFGIFFMLLSLFYLIKTFKLKTFKQKRKLYAIMTGIFLSLTVGTHHLTAVYYAFTLLTVLGITMLTKQSRIKYLHPLLLLMITGIVMSLPYTSTYLYMLENRINVGIIDLNIYDFLWYASKILPNAFLLKSFNAYMITYSLAIAGFILMAKYFKYQEVKKVIISLLIALVPLFFLLPIRGMAHLIYYLLIPVFLALALFLDKTLRLLQRQKLPGRLILSTFLLLILVIQVSASYNRLDGAVSWYQVLDDDSIDALNWISKNVPKNATLLACDGGLNVWIEGYAHHKALSGPKPLSYYVVTSEFEKAFISNIICLGNYVARNGYIVLVDEFPHGYYTPGIFLRTPDYQVPLIYFFDEAQSLTFSTKDNKTHYANMLSAATKTLEEVSLASNELFIQYKYEWSFGSVSRACLMFRSEPKIRLIYDVTIPGAFINRLDIKAIVHHTNKVLVSETSNNGIILSILTSEGRIVEVGISLVNTSSLTYNITYNPQDPLTKLPTATFTVKPSAQHVNVTIEVFISPARNYGDELRFWNSNELLKKYHIEYIVLDKKASYLRFIRFTHLPNFIPVYENQRILILKVEGG